MFHFEERFGLGDLQSHNVQNPKRKFEERNRDKSVVISKKSTNLIATSNCQLDVWSRVWDGGDAWAPNKAIGYVEGGEESVRGVSCIYTLICISMSSYTKTVLFYIYI